MLECLPYVPIAGHVRIGVAIFSYDGGLTFGVTGDYDEAPDIDVLCLESRSPCASSWRRRSVTRPQPRSQPHVVQPTLDLRAA